MRRRITVSLLIVGLSASVQAQTMEIEGRVYAGVEGGCWLLDDIYTGTSFELYGGGPELYRHGVWAIVWGSVSGAPNFCMQGVPFDVTSYLIVADCDDGNPCTDDFFEPGGCVHAPTGGSELIVVGLPGLVGSYLFNARVAGFSLGFTPFDVGCVAVDWAGGIHTSTVDCPGGPQGFGGTLSASFMEQPSARATYSETLGEPSTWIPFERKDVFAGGPFEALLDGEASVQVFFQQIIQECTLVEPASAVLDWAKLIISARRMHDFDNDGNVDVADALAFGDCMRGPGIAVEPDCLVFDADRDGDGDLADFARLLHEFTGPLDGSGPCGTHCGDGVAQPCEACDEGPGNGAGNGYCLADCSGIQLCGDGIVSGSETCDDGNIVSGDGCDAACQTEVSVPANDSCDTPQDISEGTISFTTDGATTDTITEVGTCATSIEWGADVWFRYQAPCTDTATLSLCGSRYDTTAAVYDGDGCPSEAALACNDDGCGTGSDLPSSRLTFPAVEGNTYMIRIGGYVGESGPSTGTGSLTIFCGNDSGRGPANCGLGNSDCFTVDPAPTCSDADCCSTICALDPFCCDVEWDGVCVEEGVGICGEGFAACTGATGDCFAEHPDQTPGCEIQGCCQSVCEGDPFCCLDYWDEFCAQGAVQACSAAEVCADATGSCFGVHATPGCGTQSCCESVCLEDPYCCTNEWDQSCVDLAASCR